MCELHNKLQKYGPYTPLEVWNGEKIFQYMVQPIFTSLGFLPPPPTTTHPPPPSKKNCFKRIKHRGWYKISDRPTQTTNQKSGKPKSVPRGGGDGNGPRGSDNEEEWLLVAEEEVDLVCEMSWPTSRLTGWVNRCEVDVYSKVTHRWTSSIFIMSTPFAKSKLYTLFVAFFVAFSHSTYTCRSGVLDPELAQILWHAFDTHTVSTHSWTSSIFIMSTPFAKSKL